MSELAFLSVSEICRRLEDGSLDAVTLVEDCLARIERYDDKLHSFIAVYADDARRAAEAADLARASGHSVSRFHGVPVGVKDIIDINGRVTTGGSKMWADRVSTQTATLVERMISAGMIILGKTHTVEFAMGGWGTNQHFGSPRNPWDGDTHRAAGGSSAGSGVSVAAGLVPWAIGTDTGGSVRLPAAWCGLTGLKTTLGRISCYGVLPLAASLDTPGPMCRTVEDAAHLFAVLTGPDPRDPLTLGLPATDPFSGLRTGVRGLRVGRISLGEFAGVDADVESAYESSIEVFRSLGAEIVPIAPPRSFDELGATVGRIIGAEGYGVVGDFVDDLSLPIDEDVRPRIWIGKNMSARDYRDCLSAAQTIAAEFDAVLGNVDVLLTPTVASPAPAVASIDQTGSPAGFTRLVNLIKRCALTQPNGMSRDGLPTAHQIICPAFDEATALRVGWAFENATDFSNSHPAL